MSEAATNIRVATATRCITPEGDFFPCYLCGHAIRTELATGILSDIWATALLLEVDGVLSVTVTIELIGLEREYTNDLRARIAQATGAAFDLVHVDFVHTHSAPEPHSTPIFGAAGQTAVPGYMEWVAGQALAAVAAAQEAGLVPATAWCARTQIEGLYSNRNGIEKPADKEAALLEFRAADGGVVAGAYSFACHSTVLGPQNREVSGDLAAYLADRLQERWGVRPVCLVGAAGDMSNRMYRQGNDQAELERVGGGMYAQLPTACGTQLFLHAPKTAAYTFDETYEPDKAKKRAQYESIKERVANATTFDEYKVFSSALAGAEAGLDAKPFRLLLECQLIDMGDLRLFKVPAELFSRFGVAIKEALGGVLPLCWCYCDYATCYLGNREDYGASFETAGSDVPVGTTERFVDGAIAFIKENL